MQARHTPYLS
jgi:hypothetical protein